MPPFLSNIFGADQSATETGVSADQDLELSTEVQLSAEAEYQDADGATHSYANETTIGADISAETVLDVVIGSDHISG